MNSINPFWQNAETSVAQQYLDALSLIERLHRLLLDVIKDEFERLGFWKSTRFKHCYCSISVKTR